MGKFFAVIGVVGGIVTIYVAAWSLSTWIIKHCGIVPPDRAHLPLCFIWGALVPTVLLLVIALVCVVFQNKELRSKLGLADDELARHLLDICHMDVSLIAMEVRRDKGPGFVKAKQQQAAVLETYLGLCKQHFSRDRLLLRRLDPDDRSGAQRRFVEVKEKVIQHCDSARAILSRKGDNDASKLAIEEAGSKLLDAEQLLAHALDAMATQNRN